MKTTTGVTAVQGWSSDPSPERALREIFGESGVGDASLGIVFASAGYDLDALGETIARWFPCPVIGCSTAGEICRSGYLESGVAVAAVSGVEAKVAAIDDLRAFGEADADRLAEGLGAKDLSYNSNAAMVVLYDGLCMREEQLSSQLYMATGGVPMGGGSAGDSLTFERTTVYHDGVFRSGAGTCALLSADEGVRTFIGHHYEDTGEVLVVTAAEPDQRKIIELNGKPAATAYAEALGVDLDRLSKEDELLHPLMLHTGERSYIRGVQTLQDDGSMRLFCAIDEGVVLRVGRAEGVSEKLGAVLDAASAGIDPRLVLMFDCITRRLEADHTGGRDAFTSVVSGYPVIGFSTYGEQYNGIHVDQTVTGLVLGAPS